MQRLSSAVLLLAVLLASCEPDLPFDYYKCHCHDNSIDDWDHSKDTTLVDKRDSVGGFAISLEGWAENETHDIHI